GSRASNVESAGSLSLRRQAMDLARVNYLAVLVAGVVIFLLGGLWYSPVLFAKKWMALIGKTEEELKAGAGSMPISYALVFICGLLTSWALAVILAQLPQVTWETGALLGALCWIGFAGAPSFATAIFSGKPKGLWRI